MLIGTASELHQTLHWVAFLSQGIQLVDVRSYRFIRQGSSVSSLAFDLLQVHGTQARSWTWTVLISSIDSHDVCVCKSSEHIPLLKTGQDFILH